MTKLATKLNDALKAALVAALCALALAAGAPAQDEDGHVINLRDADINAFIEDVSSVTGYTFIVHPEVNGRVTVSSQTPLSREEVFQVFLSTLRVQGFTAIPTSNGAYRIVPETTGAVDGSFVGSSGQPDDQFVTEVMQLRHFPADEAARMIQPLINHRGQVTANGANNVLVIVDYAGNIGRIREIVAELDQDRSSILTIALENASAREVAEVVNGVSGDGAASAEISAVALESSNSIILRGDHAEIARARALVHELDVASVPTESLRVIHLEHAQAADIVPTLEAVARSMRLRGEGEELSIPFDEGTNSIILTADPQTVAALTQVVRELDVRRAQVLVEAIIVEVSDDVARDLGLQFLVSGGGNSSVPFAATNFSQSAPNILAATGAVTIRDDEGDRSDVLRDVAVSSLLGASGALIGGGGTFDNGDGLFGVILNAVENDANSNILSTPSIMTLDNEEASILVGQEVPITTGEALGADNSNPFRTIERQNVGVMLRVRPQINSGDVIQLNLRQEVSSVAGVVSPTFEELLLNTREIETTVIADNGEIIVLGGLIDVAEELADERVPILGDIPIVGRAFSSETRSQRRRNLMVFIRSSIVRDRAGARRVSAGSYASVIEDSDGETARGFDARVADALGELGPGD